MHVSPILETLNSIFLGCIMFSSRLLNMNSDSKSKCEIEIERALHKDSCILLLLNVMCVHPHTLILPSS